MINRKSLETLGFRRRMETHPVYVREFDTGIDCCRCQLRLLQDDTGWIAEIWNSQDERWPVPQRAALPRPLTSLDELMSLIAIMSPTAPAVSRD